jgi:hypothetical protein
VRKAALDQRDHRHHGRSPPVEPGSAPGTMSRRITSRARAARHGGQVPERASRLPGETPLGQRTPHRERPSWEHPPTMPNRLHPCHLAPRRRRSDGVRPRGRRADTAGNRDRDTVVGRSAGPGGHGVEPTHHCSTQGEPNGLPHASVSGRDGGQADEDIAVSFVFVGHRWLRGRSSNAVFISYRHEASWTLVEALYQYLDKNRIDTFYDRERLGAGQFATVLLNQIRARPYFLLVLTPGTLDRCLASDDWMRREIQTAVSAQRVIIPLVTPKFDLASLERYLPGGLGATILSYQAIELDYRYFQFALRKLVEEYLKPIELKVAPTPAQEQSYVNKVRIASSSLPPVSHDQLAGQAHFEEAYSGAQRGDWDSAKFHYDRALTLNPRFAQSSASSPYAALTAPLTLDRPEAPDILATIEYLKSNEPKAQSRPAASKSPHNTARRPGKKSHRVILRKVGGWSERSRNSATISGTRTSVRHPSISTTPTRFITPSPVSSCVAVGFQLRSAPTRRTVTAKRFGSCGNRSLSSGRPTMLWRRSLNAEKVPPRPSRSRQRRVTRCDRGVSNRRRAGSSRC